MRRLRKRRVGGSAPIPMIDDDHRVQAAIRRRAATRLVGATSLAAARIADAPAGYLLAHRSSDIARHATLLAGLPLPGEARVVITPGGAPGVWHLDVASRDRPGLLAAFTGVFADAGIGVVQGVVATWDDGAALEAFVVNSADAPDPHSLQEALENSLDAPLSSAPVSDALVTFDDDASPLYTRGDIVAADRPGLLHSLAVAIAIAGADVHAARVTTTDGLACDHFDLSDRAGKKLDAGLEESIRSAVLAGVSEPWSRTQRARIMS